MKGLGALCLLLFLQTAASCKAKGAAAVDVHGVDLSKSAEVKKFTEDVLAKYSTVDVLVNNAGMGTSSGSVLLRVSHPDLANIIQICIF